MPAEFVLLSEQVPRTEDFLAAAIESAPEATYLDWANGVVRQCVDSDGHPILGIFTTRPIDNGQLIAGAVTGVVPGTASYWTDITVADSTGPGLAIATALAASVGGVLLPRS